MSEKQVSILFADIHGFSRLRAAAIPNFIRKVMGSLASKIGVFRPVVKNTWGDGLFMIFHTAKEAADCAISLRDIIRHTDWLRENVHVVPAIRIALHNSAATIMKDPITSLQNAYGAHVNQAARLEPVTLPNEIFATDAFRRALDAMDTEGFAWDDLGTLQLAKDWGDTHVYRLRRPMEQTLSQRDRDLISQKSTTIQQMLPHTLDLLGGTSEAASLVRQILEHVDNYVIGSGSVRRNWRMHIRYSTDELESAGVINEYLQWSYEIVNLRSTPLECDLAVIGAPEITGDENSISYHRIMEDGREVPFTPRGPAAQSAHLFQTRSHILTLGPNERARAELRYHQVWPVSKERPIVHNCFLSRQTCFDNRMEIEGPMVDVSVLFRDVDMQPATQTGTLRVYNLPSPLLRDQAVELLLKFDPVT